MEDMLVGVMQVGLEVPQEEVMMVVVMGVVCLAVVIWA